MTSKEIIEKRKELLQKPFEEIEERNKELHLLQSTCNHTWDLGFDAITPISKNKAMCAICGKIFDI